MADEIDVEALRRAAEHPVSGTLAVTPDTMLALLSRLADAERERDEARALGGVVDGTAEGPNKARRAAPIRAAIEAAGVNYGTYYSRRGRGWSHEEALLKPRGRGRPRKGTSLRAALGAGNALMTRPPDPKREESEQVSEMDRANARYLLTLAKERRGETAAMVVGAARGAVAVWQRDGAVTDETMRFLAAFVETHDLAEAGVRDAMDAVADAEEPK